MKFSKHQKEIIKQINNGKIYNIISYLKFFNLGETIVLNKDDILHKFNTDNIPKIYYYHKNLKIKYSNIISEDVYNNKVLNNELNPENYESVTLKLNYNQGIKHEIWDNKNYTINFYDGVYIAKSFNNIIDFLALWQYLKSEMLILEVPNDITANELSIFYEKQTSSNSNILSLEERIQQINFDDFTYEDSHYMLENIYTFSKEKCTICKEYLDRRIYPTTKLKIFIQKRFKTTEEKTQSSALCAAWIAIFVSIILTFLPYFQGTNQDYTKSISQNINAIKTQNEDQYNSIKTKINEMIEQINLLTEKGTDKYNNTNSSSKGKKR